MNNKKINKILLFGLNNTGLKIYTKLAKLKKLKIKLIESNNFSIKQIKKFKPDIIFSLGYRKKINKGALSYAKFGAFNLHKSLLPLHSGANPVFWTLYHGTPAGHTIHKMNNKIDSGEIVFQRKINYDFSFDAKKLYNKLEKSQIKDFFIFLNKFNYYTNRPLKNNFKFKHYHYLNDFKKFKQQNFFLQKKYLKLINLLRALNFEPFNNINFNIMGKFYSLNLNIKQLKKLKKKNYNRIKEY